MGGGATGGRREVNRGVRLQRRRDVGDAAAAGATEGEVIDAEVVEEKT